MKYSIITLILLLTVACNSQSKKTDIPNTNTLDSKKTDIQIGEYVTSITEDVNGNLWFGTINKGIAVYNGHTLTYYTKENGLPSNRVIGMLEDAKGTNWLITGAGLTAYNGKGFTNYTTNNGLNSNSISNLFIDSKGIFWVGTWEGVYTFTQEKFTPFPLPKPKVQTPINPDTENWITDITEDSKGNIWFARDGYGASVYNGTSFKHYTTDDGLNSNNVQSIVEDAKATIWIGTRVAEKDNPDPNKRTGNGGLNKYDGTKIVHFPTLKGLNKNDVYSIYKSPSGTIWISTISNGIYKYQNKKFTNIKVPKAIMSMYEDKNSNLWLGCAGGLYKITPKGDILNITTEGPW